MDGVQNGCVVTQNRNNGQAAMEDRWRITDHRRSTDQIQKGGGKESRDKGDEGKWPNRYRQYVVRPVVRGVVRGCENDGWQISLERSYGPKVPRSGHTHEMIPTTISPTRYAPNRVSSIPRRR